MLVPTTLFGRMIYSLAFINLSFGDVFVHFGSWLPCCSNLQFSYLDVQTASCTFKRYLVVGRTEGSLHVQALFGAWTYRRLPARLRVKQSWTCRRLLARSYIKNLIYWDSSFAISLKVWSQYIKKISRTCRRPPVRSAEYARLWTQFM